LLGTLVKNIGTGFGNGTVSYTNLQVTAAGSKRLTVTATGFTSAVGNLFTVDASLRLFRPPQNYVSGQGLSSLWLGNLRGKSTWRDLIAAQELENTISVRLGNDNGGFYFASTYPFRSKEHIFIS